MSNTQVEGDTRYLFKRDKTWWVKVAVPRTLRDELGYDLRRSLQTRDLNAARQSRWAVIEEFREEIEKVKARKDDEGNDRDAGKTRSSGSSNGKSPAGPIAVDQHIVEIVSDSGEGAQKCGQIMGLVSGKMGNGVWTVEIIPAEIQPPARSQQGASGIRVRMGSKYMTNMGDEADMVVAFNEQVLYSRIAERRLQAGQCRAAREHVGEGPRAESARAVCRSSRRLQGTRPRRT